MRINVTLMLIAAAIASTTLQGCGKDDAAKLKLRDGKYPPLSTHTSVTNTEARVVYSKVTDAEIREETKSAIDAIIAQHPGRAVILVQIRMSINDQLFKSLKDQNPGLSRFSEEDYYGIVDGVRVMPSVPQGITEVIDGDRFARQDLIFEVDDHTKKLDVLLKGVSLAKFAF